MFAGISRPDPYLLREYGQYYSPVLWQNNAGFTDTSGKTLRNTAINAGIKNLVLIIAGQSQGGGVTPSAYVPVNAGAIDNLNVYDGAIYAYSDPPLGASWGYLALGGSLPTPNPGSIGGRIADKLITDGVFGRIIVAPVGIGASSISLWDNGGILSNRIEVAMRRLAARGITPATTNVTFAILWMQGETESGTTTIAYQSALNNVRARAVAAGFSGRFFVCKETWVAGVVNANVQNAQTGIVDNVNFWSGGDLDSLNAGSRQTDNIHFSDAGMGAAATLIYNAMRASGAPF